MKDLTLLIKPAAGLCNMDCGYCFYKTASETRENRIMTRETAGRLIEKIGEENPSHLQLIFQGGEPTLAGLEFYAYFTEKVRETLQADAAYSIQTNGLNVDGNTARVYRDNDFLVGVSLDGGRKTNDRYRRDKNGNSVLPQVLTAIALLERYGVPYNILSVVDNENAAEIDATYAYFKKHGFYNLQFIPYVDERAGISLSAAAYEAFLKRLFDLWYDDFDPDDMIQIRHLNNYIDILAGYPPENCAMCGVCGGYFVVEANGDLYPCDFYCRPEDRIGSIFDERPFAMGEKQKRFIEESLIIRETCKHCKYYSLCRGGCKRDRIDGLTKNRYCEAYYNFFDYALERLVKVVNRLQNA